MEIRQDRLRFFRSGGDFRDWLKKNHSSPEELWLGFFTKKSGKIGITYAQALDEALCYGWIDGIRKKVDPDSFAVRFTRRRPKSIWSNVNVAHVKRLSRQGRMEPPGITAFRDKDASRTGLYSFEREVAALEPQMVKRFKRNRAAWKYFDAEPPYYRRIASWWVISARKEETRARRLEELIAHSASNQRLPQFTSSRRKARVT